jgi:hypothetical protein
VPQYRRHQAALPAIQSMQLQPLQPGAQCCNCVTYGTAEYTRGQSNGVVFRDKVLLVFHLRTSCTQDDSLTPWLFGRVHEGSVADARRVSCALIMSTLQTPCTALTHQQ